MRLLIDTHILLWALLEPNRIQDRTRQLLVDRNNVVYFSAASIWELTIKASMGRTNLQATPKQVLAAALAADFVELPILAAVTLRVDDLPLHHRDPFDRLLLAQAIEMSAKFCTVDRVLRRYGDLVDLA
ncbi:type II toxin-antitoxin system VapC family toxin [Aureimonas glaciei]|jgi:PIN domain nuclease of toxin-antitoxin system|uniref:Twitching motility protein PilT n=1 Tax=Aureimonas glaciei TaxID=1776957 RepID=A0A916Y2S3_9HYPH|nr:type II toxin-antitoxin system VapC family toxin [Aureimonas glaciei]GGD28379.1 twitching motility protein PilT [Aureimonas glaciei]